ncbi:glycosyltransferase family 4 protein [Sediminibacterium salmoneum]|uniref:glycosyltransferase family 4 protein n=1 Tax=Sediminibacterium salmoneum TaxID=426421 RepID=UPI00047B3622|nr:glycosyltransferase family 4 protein [Sediminibacterium salmoneum]
MRVTFIIYHLSSGGAERILASLVGYFYNHYDVELIVYSNEDFFFPIPKTVRVHKIVSKKQNTLFSFVNRLIKTYSVLKNRKPDVVISFLTETNIVATICSSLLRIPIIVSERTNPLKHKLSKAVLILRNFVYKYCSSLVVQTNDSKQYFEQIVKGSKIVVIPNFVDLKKFDQFDRICIPNKQILSIGRLSFEKGHDLLIKAFASSKSKQQGWKLIIVGDGPLFQMYNRLIEQLDSRESIQLVGKKKNVLEYLFSSTFFVLPSRYEGFPNVLLEATATGLPCIAFNCGMGIADVVENGFNGLLANAEDYESLKECIDSLSQNNELQSKFKRNAKTKVQDFEINKIMALWNSLIKDVCKK